MTFQHLRTSLPVPSPIKRGDVIPRAWLALPRSKAEAIVRNLPWYLPDRLECSRGHISIYRVTSSGCPACKQEGSSKQYRERHPATNIGE
ncbi:hypothetical protein [Roseovarius sp. MBR-6]|jgi:hypothetical protein|uniref:hypothetical protein n=1 Tax=Roseovarius sp. MBR-6 TaxID=3156459 RepID=UPI0033965A0A